MKMFPQRKPTRIPGYDYAIPNYYFVTICTDEKKCIFGHPGDLNAIGRIAAEYMESISQVFQNVSIQNYVVMPNHVHAIVVLGLNPQKENLPSLNTVIGQYKAAVTRKIREIRPNMAVWQRSYHDHVIRSQAQFEKIWLYIEGNPSKWEEDCFFRK